MSGNELELEMLNKDEKKRKGKIKFLLCGVLIVLAIATGLYFGYKKLGNDPVGIYKDAINNTYKVLNDFLKEAKDNSLDIDFYQDPVKFDLNAKLESNMEELKNFTNLNYHIGTGFDYSKKAMNVELGIKDKNESIINILMAFLGNNAYLKSDELFSKVIHVTEVEDIFGDNFGFTVNGNEAEFNLDNYELILKEIKTILIDSLDKKKFEITEEKITINNKEYKAKKITYLLDAENQERTTKYFADNICKNDKLLDALAASLGMDKEDIKSSIQDIPDFSNNDEFKTVLYTDNFNNIIAGEILTNNEKIIYFDCVNDEFNFYIEESNNGLFKITKDKNDLINMNYTEDEEEILDLLIEVKKNNDTKVDYRLNIEGMAFTGTIEETNIKRSKDKASGDIKFSLNTSILTKQIRIYIDGNYSCSKEELATIDTSNSIKMDEMTDTEAMNFLENLNKVLEKLGLSDLLSSIM